MADPKQEETFKVIDRRLFSEDGVLRKDVVEEEERREEEAAAKAANRAASKPPAPADANKSATSPIANSLIAGIRLIWSSRKLIDGRVRGAASRGIASPCAVVQRAAPMLMIVRALMAAI